LTELFVAKGGVEVTVEVRKVRSLGAYLKVLRREPNLLDILLERDPTQFCVMPRTALDPLLFSVGGA
jgi:hypothetical protein